MSERVFFFLFLLKHKNHGHSSRSASLPVSTSRCNWICDLHFFIHVHTPSIFLAYNYIWYNYYQIIRGYQSYIIIPQRYIPNWFYRVCHELYWVSSFAKFTLISDLVVFVTSSSCFACTTLYAESKEKKCWCVIRLLV